MNNEKIIKKNKGLFIVKRHITNQGFLTLAVCDEELLGKKFEEGKLQLNLTGTYYKGEAADKDTLLELMKKAYLCNLIGNKCINVAIEEHFVSQKDVKQIAGISYTNIHQMDE